MTAPPAPYLGPDEIARTVRRLGHEIVENNRGAQDLVIVGLLSRGYPLARRLAAAIREFEAVAVPVGALDIGLYRDDVTRRSAPPAVRPSEIPVQIDGKTIV
ncbi:MAG TPA: phosphoribosyltransferase family protein, partial [Usitatibacter sp.]|nr:phosphoribosyltransferase family protein [Usitatibacter sp.]